MFHSTSIDLSSLFWRRSCLHSVQPCCDTSQLKEGLHTWDKFCQAFCALNTSPWGRCLKLVIWYIPKIPLNRRKQSKSSNFSQDGKAISSSSCKNGADWKVSGKVIIVLWWVYQETKTGSLVWINIFIFDLIVCVNLTKRNHHLSVSSVYVVRC